MAASVAAAAAVTARSLAEAFTLRATATRLLLRASPDVACANLLCEHAGRGCACRLSLAVERMPLLAHLDVRDNALPQLPSAAFDAPSLVLLRAAGNALTALPLLPPRARGLATLDLAGNALQELPHLAALGAALPALQRLVLTGNPLSRSAAAALRAEPRLWQAAQAGEAWAAAQGGRDAEEGGGA